MSSEFPAIALARELLRTVVKKAADRGSSRLPTLDALAKSAGVSRTTMWKSVRELTRDNILVVRHGAGVFIPSVSGVENAASESGSTKYLWERTAERISSDILVGSLRNSACLPIRKELAQRYGVDLRTLRKSLASLSKDGLIRREHARHRIVRPPTPSPGKSSLVLVLPENLASLMEWSYYAQGISLFMSMLEHECENRRLVLVRRTYNQALHDADLLRNSLGSIFWVGGNETEATGFFQALPPVKAPFAVIDYWFRFPLRQAGAHAAGSLVLTFDERGSMARIGRYALELGHRHIAYFRSEDQAYAQNRLEGVLDALREAGLDTARIQVFDSRRSLAIPSAPESPAHEFGSLRSRVARIVEVRPVRDMLTNRLYESEAYVDMVRRTESLFVKALADPQITAWITETDSLAVYGALPLLAGRRIAVPERLSVMAFGDTPQAFSCGLTTVRERMDSCLEEAMRHILHPARTRVGRRYVVPDMLVVRETSGPASIA